MMPPRRTAAVLAIKSAGMASSVKPMKKVSAKMKRKTSVKVEEVSTVKSEIPKSEVPTTTAKAPKRKIDTRVWHTDDITDVNMKDYMNAWGKRERNDDRIFEHLSLQAAQAGLSWKIIFNKRDGYRKAYANFSVKKVSMLDETQKVDELMKNTEIVRNRRKIESVFVNAKAIIAIQKSHGSFANFIENFLENHPTYISYPLNTSKEKSGCFTCPYANDYTAIIAHDLSKLLSKHHFKFVGPTSLAYVLHICDFLPPPHAKVT